MGVRVHHRRHVQDVPDGTASAGSSSRPRGGEAQHSSPASRSSRMAYASSRGCQRSVLHGCRGGATHRPFGHVFLPHANQHRSASRCSVDRRRVPLRRSSSASTACTPGRRDCGDSRYAPCAPIRLERVGRPEIKNLIMANPLRDPRARGVELRDLYNREDAFAVSPAYRALYESRFDANLTMFDRLDDAIGVADAADGRHPLRDLLMDDFLILDLARPFTPGSFLEIERALMTTARTRPRRSLAR